MLVAGFVIVVSIILWICVSDVLKPGKKYGTNANSFDMYIDDTDSDAEPVANAEDSATDKYSPLYTDPGRQILLLYGTEYGFSEEVAKTMFDRLTQADKEGSLGLQPRLLNAKHHQHLQWAEEQLALIVISTSGDGVPPSSAMEWYNSFISSDVDLSHLAFSVLALGDSNYPHFCRVGKKVYQRFEELRARSIVPRGDVDMEDWSVINTWMDKVITSIKNYEVRLEERIDYLSPLLVCSAEEEGFHRLKPFMATLKVKEQLTVSDETCDKETLHCEFLVEGSGLAYTSGDAVGIYPTNRSEDVDWVLRVSGLSGDSPGVVPSSAYQPKPASGITLKMCLLKYYDLKNVRVSLLETLLRFSEGNTEEKLRTLLKDGTSRTNKALIQYLEAVEVGDVLEDFPTKIPASDFLGSLRPLQPRYYSISSSPLLDPNNICVTAAVIRYSSRGRSRVGVATTYLQDRLDPNDLCPVFISPNPDFRLPRVGSTDIIMIGPGTGIAPFRAFIQERVATGASGKNVLYFGCRHREKDYLYRKELEDWSERGHILLRTAFSRDSPRKEYVQHLIQQDSQMIWNMIQNGAHIYVCGDARQMASDVHGCLLAIIETEGKMTQEGAIQFIKGLEDEQRYQKDVWVS